MGVEKIHIEQFLELAKNYPVFDVRSPGEYNHAHIPGACSLPLFTDEERKVVGTTYKQQSREEAIKIGLDYFGPKMRKMVEEVESIIGNQESGQTTKDSRLVLIHCWRGGMRSGAVSWLLDLYGFKVYTLIGGYKEFRNDALNFQLNSLHFNILGGYMVCKTELLKALKERERVIDLEDIAKHKGSAFGSIGMPKQPGQEMFETRLALSLHEFRGQGSEAGSNPSLIPHPSGIWLEDESSADWTCEYSRRLMAKYAAISFVFS